MLSRALRNKVSPCSKYADQFQRDLLTVLHFAESVTLGPAEFDDRLRSPDQISARQLQLLFLTSRKCAAAPV